MTITETKPCAFNAEFPDEDLDTICISAVLNTAVAEAIADRVLLETIDDDLYEDDELEHYAEEATRVLSVLVERGWLRREDFTYDEDTHTVVRS